MIRTALAILLLAHLSAPARAIDKPPVDRARAVRALLQISSTPIPPKRVACEVAGPTITHRDDSVSYRRTTVGDILQAYILWALEHRPTHQQSFTCTGKKVLQCEWQFGDRPHAGNPGSTVFLKFQLDPRGGRVLPATLECFNVP
jgi:hypothetical protein